MVITTLNRQTEIFLDNEARRIGFIGEHHSPESITASISEAELTPQIDLEFQGNVVAMYEFPLSQADKVGLDPETLGTSGNAAASKRTNKSDTSIYVAEWKTGTTNDTAAVEYTTYFYWRPPAVTEIKKASNFGLCNTTFSSGISKRSPLHHTGRHIRSRSEIFR
jgi:hypothetical protein